MDVAKGCIFQGKSTDIVYLFPNNFAFGHVINLNIRQNREHLLVKNYFSNLIVYFTDQNNCYIDFMQYFVTFTFDIRQV